MSRFVVSLVLVSVASFSSFTAARADEREGAFVVVRGRAVCLDVSGRPVDFLFACTESTPKFGFASKEGKLYRFASGDSMAAVFNDVRVRQREVQITGRLRGDNELEIIKLQSIKDGKLYDIYYFCDVCSIKSFVPGPCPCCRNELEFRETPQ